MIDQAESLRQLVMSVAKSRPSRKPGGVLVVLGARPGVGATTISVNLSVAFAQRGCNVTLVDADFEQPAIHQRCGLVTRTNLKDLVQGDRTIREISQVGPAGINILPGCRLADDDLPLTAGRLAEQISLLAESQLVIVDLGKGVASPDLYRVADDVIVVTTVDVESVMDAYTAVKQTACMLTSASFWSVVNQHADPLDAEDVQQRIATSCDRFLNLGIRDAGSVPADPVVHGEDERAARPVVLKVPQSPASAAFAAISTRLMDARRRRGLATSNTVNNPVNSFT